MVYHTAEEHIDENMMKMEVNLDDITGEFLGYLMEKLLKNGVNDVFYTPIYMKKNRPATMLTILTDDSNLDSIKEILFKETTTLGIRYYPTYVHRLAREYEVIHTEWGDVTVKLGLFQGEIVNASPEYTECCSIAKNYNIPLKKVYNKVWESVSERY